MRYINFLFEIVNEDADIYGKQYFVEMSCDDTTNINQLLGEAEAILESRLRCDHCDYEYLGIFTPELAETCDYDNIFES